MQLRAHLWTPGKVNRMERYSAMPRDVNSAKTKYRLSSQIPSFNTTSVSQARFRNQEVIGPSHPGIAKRGRNADPFDSPMNAPLAINSHSTSYFSVVIGSEAVTE